MHHLNIFFLLWKITNTSKVIKINQNSALNHNLKQAFTKAYIIIPKGLTLNTRGKPVAKQLESNNKLS